MKKNIKAGLVAIIIFVLLVGYASIFGCANQSAWRKVTVETYELVGAGLGSTPNIASQLLISKQIDQVQYDKIKGIYLKARTIYIQAGGVLKLAGQAASAKERDKFLEEYSILLSQFKVLANEVYTMISNWKQISYFEMERDIMGGKTKWVQ